MKLYIVRLKRNGEFLCVCFAFSEEEAVAKAAKRYDVREFAFTAERCKEGVNCLC